MGDVLTRGGSVRIVTVAGRTEGRGHVARSLAIGEAIASRGVRVSLDLVRGELTAREAAHAEHASIAPSTSGEAAVVVIDAPDPASIGSTSDAARLVVLDDADVFDGRAAMVVQPSLPTWSGRGVAARVLAGYDYAPIGTAYRRWRGNRRSRTNRTPRVVACFGGTDPADASARLAEALEGGDEWRTELVLGPGYTGGVAGSAVPIQRDPEDLPGLLATADVAVLGAGTLKFEAACLGVPALLLAVADDQVRVGPAFAATGAATYLGDARTIAPNAVHDAIGALLAEPARLAAMSDRAGQVVDGLGAERIADAIIELIAEEERS
jgi:spore coat polysaccharide biosynthesis predicted glycosyltransferase SpsG